MTIKIGVIGGGPAGMMAAYAASLNKDTEVTLIERNEKLGKKLYITGKGRCNITNSKDIESLMDNIVTNRNFTYSCLYTLTNEDLINLLKENGLKTKVERGGRVFPVSDKSSDVIKTIEKMLINNRVNIRLNTHVKEIIQTDTLFNLVSNHGNFNFDKLIIATGGKSYPVTGSTGDGYNFVKKLGHHIIDLRPSLVPISLKDDWIPKLMGVSLKNVALNLSIGGKKSSEFGDLVFTRDGISGPIVLRASSYLNKVDADDVTMSLDLKPALDDKTFDKRLIKELEKANNKSLANMLENVLIKSLIPIVLKISNLDGNKKSNEITRNDRKNLLKAIKRLPLNYKNLKDIKYAIITSGGVDTLEINSSTMESKLVNNIYIAGELLDIDALTGGYNLQIAFSSGYLAGLSASSMEVNNEL